MKNPLNLKEWSVAQVILALWLVFSVLYVARDLRENVVQRLYQAGLQTGRQSAIVQILDLADQCQPISVFIGEGEARREANLVNPGCEASAEAATGGEEAATE